MASPRSCRIVIFSSSITQGKEFAERLVASAEPPAAGFKDEETVELPWTISNKYYTAPVHFLIAPTADIQDGDTKDVPACIFVFSLAEPFKDEFKALTARLARADFEVSIAVSVPAPGPSPEPSTDDERDAFFGAHGFEYVNGHSPPTADHATAPTEGPSHPHRVPAPNPEHEGVPGISRIADALSTILWPSMVRRAAPQRLLPPDNDNDGDGDGLLSLLRRREMIALERWLEQGANDDEDDEDGPDPWAGALRSSEPQAASGFDDNFSDFVSAGADPALPSRADVAAVSRRIFDAGGCAEDADADADADADGGCAQAPFDLSRVLGALEAMKEEIAGIADEDEKRRAAAKVALGLVYGLEEG